MLEVLTGTVRCYVWCMMLLRSEGKSLIRSAADVFKRAPLRMVILLSPLCWHLFPLELAFRQLSVPDPPFYSTRQIEVGSHGWGQFVEVKSIRQEVSRPFIGLQSSASGVVLVRGSFSSII
ncbi:hypothetical protein Tco_0530153 [Tanacetum coccineum]